MSNTTDETDNIEKRDAEPDANDLAEEVDAEHSEHWLENLRLLKAKLANIENLQRIRSREAIQEIAEQSVFPVLEKLMMELTEFDELFATKQMWFGSDSGASSVENIYHIRKTMMDNYFLNDILFKYELKGFKKAPLTPFNVMIELHWKLDEYIYSFRFDKLDPIGKLTHYYHEHYTLKEINLIIARCGSLLLKKVQNGLENLIHK